jgi:predicted choloylglycine hydrolase
MSTERGGGLAFLEASGSPHDVGAALGRFGRRAVHEHLVRTRAWTAVVAHSRDARTRGMAASVEARFPRCFAELRGLAEGLGLPFDEVFAWNCRGDILTGTPDGCTTVQLPGARRVIAHNEDGDPGLRGHCAILHAVPEGGIAFTAFVYPGSLPGHAFAANDAGLVQTVNNIRSLDVGDGVPRMVLTRALLECGTLDEAVATLRNGPRAGSFHLTLAQAGDARLLGIEFTARACSVREITAPAAHANHLVHPATVGERQIVTASSASRQRRAVDLLAAGADPLAILRDTGGPGLPIRRDDPCDPDAENTLATAVFTLERERLDWNVYDTPDDPARFHIRERLVPAA